MLGGVATALGGGAEAAGDVTGVDLVAQAAMSSPSATDATIRNLMIGLRSPDGRNATHFFEAASIFCMRSISIDWSA